MEWEVSWHVGSSTPKPSRRGACIRYLLSMCGYDTKYSLLHNTWRVFWYQVIYTSASKDEQVGTV